MFDKYVPGAIDMIVEGIVDGKQGEKLKTIVPQTDLNMVGTLLCSAVCRIDSSCWLDLSNFSSINCVYRPR